MEKEVACSNLIRQIHVIWERSAGTFQMDRELHLTQVGAIAELAKADGHEMTLKELEKSLGLSQSVVARMANQLIADGYAKEVAVPTDKRVKRVRLTQKALEFNQETIRRMDIAEELLLDGMSPGERLLFRELLERAMENSIKGTEKMYGIKHK